MPKSMPPRIPVLVFLSSLLMGAHCECPDEAVVPASYDVQAGEFSAENVSLSFDDCSIEGNSEAYFSTDEVPTTLHIECGTPVLDPAPGQPLFRLTVPLGDMRESADQDIDLSQLNLIVEWSGDGVPVGPSPVPVGGMAVVRTVQRIGASAPYPSNVSDDFVLEFTVEIVVPAFSGRGGAFFPGGTIELAVSQDAADYRRDPGPDPDCH
jgi:hypothetical protein